MAPKTILLVCFIVVISLVSTTFGSIGGYICPAYKKKFLDIALKTLKNEPEDLSAAYYGAKTYKLLSEPLPKDIKATSCSNIKKLYKPELSSDASFYALNAWSLLQCEGKLHTEVSVKELRSTLENDKSSVPELRFAAETLTLLNTPVPNAAKVAQHIQAKLKADDSLQNLGHALHAASILGTAGKFINDRIEDIIVQADEVDGKLLQWEGGLSVTSLLITGLLRLQGVTTLNQEQADKMCNYLLTRKTVPTPKGVTALLEAATALSSSKFSPVSISIVGPAQVNIDKPELKIQVSNIFGQPLKPVPSPIVAQSATRIVDDVVVLAKQPLSGGTKETEFVLPLKLEPGHYKIALNAGSHATTLNARVLGPIEVKNFEIGLLDSDGSSVPKLMKLSYPAKLDAKLQGDAGQQLQMKFGLSKTVHQAFIRLHSDNKEIIFVAEQDSAKLYKVEINLGQELSSSGVFNIELIIGDSIITNPFRWNIGSVEVNLGSASTPAQPKIIRGPKPEIKHMFRVAEKRPAKTVSLFFTGLTAAPFLVLLVLWGKVGVNFGNFSAIAFPFHLGFGSILGLFTLFWLKLNMFTTCAWLIPIGGFTFFAGHKMLSQMAKKRKPEKADK